MPITRKEFELLSMTTEECMKEIYGFLIKHKEEAFSYNELREEFDLPIRSSPDLAEHGIEDTFDKALQTLVELGAVEKRHIKFVDFYSYGPNPLQI